MLRCPARSTTRCLGCRQSSNSHETRGPPRNYGCCLRSKGRQIFHPSQIVRNVEMNRTGAFAVIFSQPEKSGPLCIDVVNLANGETIDQIASTAGADSKAVLSDDGSRLALYSGKSVQTFDTRRGAPLSSKLAIQEHVRSVLFSPDAEMVAIEGAKSIYLWRPARDTNVLPDLQILDSRQRYGV